MPDALSRTPVPDRKAFLDVPQFVVDLERQPAGGHFDGLAAAVAFKIAILQECADAQPTQRRNRQKA